jgi:hypothetical protein
MINYHRTEEPKAKRTRSSKKAVMKVDTPTSPLPELPVEIVGLIINFSYTTSTKLKEFLELRTVAKSWAAATAFQSSDFWRRLSERFMRTSITKATQDIVRKYYNDDWFHYSRYWYENENFHVFAVALNIFLIFA